MTRATPARLPGLDILRGLAILLVLIRHAFPDVVGSAGIVGVVVFFTLSGYLITGVLMRDITTIGRVRYGHFYRNRALRLLPALVVVVAAFAFVEITTNVLGDRSHVLKTVLVALTYTADIPVLNDISLGLSHLWTLAVEEQFYLVWPLLLTVAVRWNKVRTVLIITASLAFVVCLATIVVAAPDVSRVYRLPTSWVIPLLAGAAAQLWRQRVAAMVGRAPRAILISGPLIVLLGLSVVPDSNNSPALYLIGAPIIAASTVVLIMQASLLSVVPGVLKPFNYLGQISYGAYLWNYLIAMWLHVDGDGGWRGVLSIVATIAAASASWYAIERPFLKLKPRLDARTGNRRVRAPSEIPER
jgi:peptidoglycan/LPS O-acetylase OafA/YrhL